MKSINCCKSFRYILLLLMFLIYSGVFAQSEMPFSIRFDWNGIQKYKSNDENLYRVSFEGACYNEESGNKNPFYTCSIPIWDDNLEADFELKINESEPVPHNEIPFLQDVNNKVPDYTYSILNSRDNSSMHFTLLPFYMRNDTMMRIVSCDVAYSLKQMKRGERKVYVENSVLDSGKWYMMSMPSTGIYKITYSELEAMGLPVSGINPKNIRIYHNGGGVLPVVNSAERHQDLVEIPIYVSGENDGSFDADDYVVFYAKGPVSWECYNGLYSRVSNPYSDYSYAFLTTDLGEGKRIEYAENTASSANVVVNSFLDYQLIEEDAYNLNNMGATWYFDKFDAVTSKTYSFNFPNIIKTENCNIRIDAASRNTVSLASFDVKVNGNHVCDIRFNKTTSGYAMVGSTNNVKFISNTDNISVNLNYVKNASSSSGWIDYIAINAWRELIFTGNVMMFRNPHCFDASRKYRYEIRNASGSLQVWNVTNPVEPEKMNLQYASNVASFTVDGADNSQFIAFNGNEYNKVNFVSVVENQNLHSKYDFDYLIITHPDFKSQALRLKELHSTIDDLEIEIVTPQQIYNEFSCGALDITAIRDYIKMIYDKSDKRLKYVLLFGDCSFDFKNKSGNVCFIPSYQSEVSLNPSSNVYDDFFVALDDKEGDMSFTFANDAAIGRMPVNTLEEAKIVVDKIERYISNDEDSMGHWRKLITFVADDDDTYYMSHAEQIEQQLKGVMGDDINFDKIFLDAYPQIATSSGQRSPECNAAITNRIEQGSLIVNYIGHAGELGWAEERILTNDDIFSWKNSPKLNLMLAASCEFSRFDDHTRTSAGEYVFLNKNGGAIAMYTAARVTYASQNQRMMKRFYDRLFDVEGGDFVTMGDAFLAAKQEADDNCHDYVFFGDPALRLNYPKNKIELTSINNHDVSQIDTIRALQSINIKGVVKDIFGNPIDDFNGIVHVNVYDKESTYTTFGNESSVYSFKLRDNVIFTGKMPVVNGEFDLDLTLPKDINYSYGNGLMSFYASSEKTDAQGSFANFIIGGLNHDADPDELGPEMEIYIDDEKFVDGSTTNENPLLIAYLKDDNGINTSSAGIGHDITATLSGATNKTYSLNQFYESPMSEGDFGKVTYKLYNLNEGEHLLTFRAWDIYNNSSTATIWFNVVKGKIVNIENVANYPNPMSDNTNFVFEHNQKDNEIDIQIRIYNIVGQLVRTIEESSSGTMARISSISWDGTSDNGAKLPAGMYVYYVTVTNSHNEKTSVYSKLIIK